MNVLASATSAITTTYTNPVGSLAGNGWIAEDPVVTGANGASFEYQCDVSHATWYNLVSDQNFQVNANCDGTPYWSELYQFNVMAGTHTIAATPTLTPVMWPGYGNINREVWTGDVTIDGQFYPAAAGTHTYLNDTSAQITVTVTVGQPGVSGSATNYVVVTTPTYSTSIAYDSDDDGSYNLGFANIQIAATNAGACSNPGGVWGKTLSGVNDATASDFVVSSSTAKVAQFSATCGIASTSTSTAKITQ